MGKGMIIIYIDIKYKNQNYIRIERTNHRFLNALDQFKGIYLKKIKRQRSQ